MATQLCMEYAQNMTKIELCILYLSYFNIFFCSLHMQSLLINNIHITNINHDRGHKPISMFLTLQTQIEKI